ncbi:glycosyltransferase family 2 protein [Nocardioides sp.]|uniref:glycosyltransferase family 2 protein n=1 Tax=Nocardioides sp. TaxID=35761 RepID=UPI00356A9C89
MRLTRRRGPADSGPVSRVLEPGELPSVGVITMARDEGPMLRHWVEHYADQVGAEHVLVIDDNSSDGSTDDLGCPVIRIPQLRKRGFEPSRMGLLAGISAGLLEAYDAMLFTDADEFVVADPARHESLRHFAAARAGREAVGVMGLNLIHDTSREPALDFDRPLLQQRTLAKFMPLMCKPALKWVPAAWAHASHGILCPFEVDPELFMFHFKFADRGRLEEIAGLRHHVNTTDNRAAGTSWARPADEMVALLDEVAAAIKPGRVEEFDPAKVDLAGIVKKQGPMWRATGKGQVPGMRSRPVVSIPARFRGVL